MGRARYLTGALLSLTALHLSAAAPLAPEVRPFVGRHLGELCVATLPAAANCGPAQVDLRSDGSVRVRIDDVVYRMQLRSSQIEIVLMHGAVQIDEFTVPYAWVGSTLQFRDDAKNARYEIRFPASKSADKR